MSSKSFRPIPPRMTNLEQIWTCRPLIRSVTHQRVMSDGPESPKYAHKLVILESVHQNAFNTIYPGWKRSKVAKLVNLAQIVTCRPLIRFVTHQRVVSDYYIVY